jgi:ketosteroid isomerase-like protein
VDANFDPVTFAHEWAAKWGRRDYEAILTHFAEDCEFRSPLARDVVGSPILKGKDALRAYWATAAGRINKIHFTVDRVAFESNTVSVFYTADLDGRRRRACESMTFGKDGLVVLGEVFYGVDL